MIGKYTNNDSLAESVSSLLDDALSRDDIDRLLASDEKEWQEKMQAYTLASSLLNTDKDVGNLAEYNLLGRIREVIDQDDAKTVESQVGANVVDFKQSTEKHLSTSHANSSSMWKKTFGSLALAASVAFVVISGGSYVLDSGEPVVQPIQASINSLPVDLKPLQHVNVVVENKRLQNYLRQHAEQSTMAAGQGMLPMARVVSYPIGQE